MTNLYLVTGFLGAGKTTFLKQFVRCFPGRRLALVVNEFGAVGVDGALLDELGLTLTEIDNGSIFCACRAQQFQDTLLATLEKGPDVIVVEASGLSDPTDVGKMVAQPEFAAINYAGAICLVDAARFHKVYATARVCKKQLAVANAIVVNKTDLADLEQLQAIRRECASLRPGVPVFETSYGCIDPGWLEQIISPTAQDGTPVFRAKDVTLQKLTLHISPKFTVEQLERFVGMFAEDTYRVKGFVRLNAGIFHVDCVGPIIKVESWRGTLPEENDLAVLFGNGLPAKKSIQTAIEWYPDMANIR